MMRNLLTLAVLSATLCFAAKASFALDPRQTTGVGGIGRSANVTAGSGRASDDGLAHTGFPSRTGSGMIGVTGGGVSAGTNKGTEDGFHAAGMGKVITAGIGRSTNETVPGRSPTYINLVVGTRTAPLMGSRAP
jgi:hypothetical protein